jgi:hypothetical protein
VIEIVAERLRDLGDVSYFGPLASLLSEQGALDIATLNYDLTIETFAQQEKLDLCRGVERRQGDGSLGGSRRV